jgi:hypothetical protein
MHGSQLQHHLREGFLPFQSKREPIHILLPNPRIILEYLGFCMGWVTRAGKRGRERLSTTSGWAWGLRRMFILKINK